MRVEAVVDTLVKEWCYGREKKVMHGDRDLIHKR